MFPQKVGLQGKYKIVNEMPVELSLDLDFIYMRHAMAMIKFDISMFVVQFLPDVDRGRQCGGDM